MGSAVPIFTFTAYSNTGKTTYLERLIAELKARGVRVGALKHDAHEFEIDTPGKDSWRFARAGADVVAVASATKAAVMDYRPVGFSELVGRMKNIDVIIVEGWHSEGERLVCIYRESSGKGMKVAPDDCAAVVSDVPLNCAAPVFPLDDPAPMAEFIMREVGLAKY